MMPSSGESVVIRRRIRATREELFEAWTDPAGMREWMCPGDVQWAEVHMDLRVGGAIHIRMHAPHQVHEHRGEFTIVERPSRLAFTWTLGPGAPPNLVTVEFLEIGPDETELVLTHEKFSTGEAAGRYRNGWGRIAERLEEVLGERHA